MSADRWAARPEVLRPVSEWAVPELAVALSISETTAQARLERGLILVQRLPGTLAALEAGALHAGHVPVLIDLVAPIEDAEVRAEVEAGLLRWAAGRVVTPAQLRERARREVARRDARAAARRLERALRRRGVHLSPEAPDGLAAVTAAGDRAGGAGVLPGAGRLRRPDPRRSGPTRAPASRRWPTA